MTREKIKILPSQTLSLTLEQVRGKEYPSKFGDGTEYLFNVQFGGQPCMIYLPVDGQVAITNSGARAGDEIQITKNKNGTFAARLVSDAVLAVPAPPQNGPRLLAPRAPQTSTPFERDNQRRDVPQQPHTLEVVDEAPRGAAAMLERCYVCAIDVLSGAVKYAQQKEWKLAFNEEDVRALAATIFINFSGKVNQ